MLTVYGIETLLLQNFHRQQYCLVATVLTVYGIETTTGFPSLSLVNTRVATVLTVYGIETEEQLLIQFY